jgi:hypothetical protein
MAMILRNITCRREYAESQARRLAAEGYEIVMTTNVLSDDRSVDIWYRVSVE